MGWEEFGDAPRASEFGDGIGCKYYYYYYYFLSSLVVTTYWTFWVLGLALDVPPPIDLWGM